MLWMNHRLMRETSLCAKTKSYKEKEKEKGKCLSFFCLIFVKIAKLAKIIKCFDLNIKTCEKFINHLDCCLSTKMF